MSSLGELELEWWGPGTVPAAGSIVWSQFPKEIGDGVPGPKNRPALVLKSRYATDPPGDRFYVQVAYGTSVLKTGKRPHDFVVANSVSLDMLRLPKATRFDLDKIVWLPWAKPWFVPRTNDDAFCTPVMSVLTEDMKRILGWTMARREGLGLLEAYRAPAPAPEQSLAAEDTDTP